jgi:hypothetical protein
VNAHAWAEGHKLGEPGERTRAERMRARAARALAENMYYGLDESGEH